MAKCKQCGKDLRYWQGDFAGDTGLCFQCRSPRSPELPPAPKSGGPPTSEAPNPGSLNPVLGWSAASLVTMLALIYLLPQQSGPRETLDTATLEKWRGNMVVATAFMIVAFAVVTKPWRWSEDKIALLARHWWRGIAVGVVAGLACFWLNRTAVGTSETVNYFDTDEGFFAYCVLLGIWLSLLAIGNILTTVLAGILLLAWVIGL